jgi:hypothetical protein
MPVTTCRPASHLDQLVEEILAARDCCGDEVQVVRDWKAEHGPLSESQFAAVFDMVDLRWGASQRAAGVQAPIDGDEMRCIERDLDGEWPADG